MAKAHPKESDDMIIDWRKKNYLKFYHSLSHPLFCSIDRSDFAVWNRNNT